MHLSNLPENLAFFSGAIDAAGSFGGIYQSAVLAYGSDLIRIRRTPSASSAWPRSRRSNAGAASRTRRSPSRRSAPAGPARSRPTRCCRKDIRFLFEPNSSTLDLDQPGEPARTSTSSRSCSRSARARRSCCAATSTTRMVEEFRKQGGDALRAHPGAQGDGAVEEARRRDQAQMLIERLNVDAAAHRGGRPRLGRAGPRRPRREPARRGAVVHDRVPSRANCERISHSSTRSCSASSASRRTG